MAFHRQQSARLTVYALGRTLSLQERLIFVVVPQIKSITRKPENSRTWAFSTDSLNTLHMLIA
jgi:hypothetical protein